MGNKQTLYASEDTKNLKTYVKAHHVGHAEIVLSDYGHFPVTILNGKTLTEVEPAHTHHHSSKPLMSEQALPDEGFLKAENHGEGFQSVGWRFSSQYIFDRNALFSNLEKIHAERVKGVFITEQGVFGFNKVDNVLSYHELDDCIESRIEIISKDMVAITEETLLACLFSS